MLTLFVYACQMVAMLRDFQIDLKDKIFAAWREPNTYNVMPVAPTGAGKTVLVGDVIKTFAVPTCAIAHRQELVAQMALAMNRERIPHGVIAPKPVIQAIIAAEHETHGYSDYNFRADVRVAGVDTLAKIDKTDRWLSTVGLGVIDEGHHVLKANKWGKALALFPNARGLFPTAHAIRADGAGLGRGSDGLVDALVIGPSCRDLINRGYLTDYSLLCPGSDIDFSDVPIGATGDYSMPKLRAKTHASNRIVGDVVRHYLKYASGKLGITFAVDIAAARELEASYRASGVPCAVITSETPIAIRAKLLGQFRQRQLLQLVSVDCLGEGVDVPAVEVVSLVRKTASWQLYCQQIGRALRPLLSDEVAREWGGYTDAERLASIAASSKPTAIIIDHVGNCIYHGLPDVRQEYSLASAERRARNGAYMPLRSCSECTRPYERFLIACPYCGHEPIPAGRSTPEQVDGDLIELSPEILARIRGDVAKIDGPCYFPVAAGGIQRGNILRAHHERFVAQKSLRETMALWGGWREHTGESTREAQKRFYLTFGVDYMTAQTLDAEKAEALKIKIAEQLARYSVTEAQNV
jgi:superfamily II DNA or RNA helicase